MATTKKPDSARAGANLDSGESNWESLERKKHLTHKDRLWKYSMALRYYQENSNEVLVECNLQNPS